jgi:hypothetical protein
MQPCEDKPLIIYTDLPRHTHLGLSIYSNSLYDLVEKLE